jgi:hypothetical protein
VSYIHGWLWFVIRLSFIYALSRLRYSAADLSDEADSSYIARFLVRINATTKAKSEVLTCILS